MKHALISAVVAAVVCVVAFAIEARLDPGRSDVGATIDASGIGNAMTLDYTVEPTEDSWVNGARGAGTDERLLSDSENSICFLTKIEISGIQSPADTGTCRIAVDEFTGFWEVTADVPEGSQAEIRCNARCLVWE